MIRNNKLVYLVISCFFVALISVGAYIAFPVPGSPVPIVLQNLFIMLAALLLGPVWGLVSVALYLLLGLMGLPVFAGGTGGLVRFLGPTGGYLIGYLPAAFIMGLLSSGKKRYWWKDAIALILGSFVVYAFGVLRLQHVLKVSFEKAIVLGFLPYYPGDVLKIVLAVLLSRSLFQRIQDKLNEYANDK